MGIYNAIVRNVNGNHVLLK